MRHGPKDRRNLHHNFKAPARLPRSRSNYHAYQSQCTQASTSSGSNGLTSFQKIHASRVSSRRFDGLQRHGGLSALCIIFCTRTHFPPHKYRPFFYNVLPLDYVPKFLLAFDETMLVRTRMVLENMYDSGFRCSISHMSVSVLEKYIRRGGTVERIHPQSIQFRSSSASC